jgi:hypothetical protein
MALLEALLQYSATTNKRLRGGMADFLIVFNTPYLKHKLTKHQMVLRLVRK